MNKKKSYVILVIVSTLFISYLHYSTIPENHKLHNIYAELYYIPVLLGALAFGVKGAILTYLFVSAVYIPFIFLGSSETFLAFLDKSLHIVFTGVFAAIAGLLVDRERKYQRQQGKDRYLAGLGQAASALAHDLKNPLITISGYAKRIKEGKGNTSTASQVILDSAQKMDRIVRDVLDFAKPVQLELKNENLGQIIISVCHVCSMKAIDAGITLNVRQPSDSVFAQLDRIKIERALINLINNSIEASSTGGSVDIAFVPEDDIITVKIIDHGTGMDKETLDNIFIPFFSTKQSGTGLGMAIAKKIIEEHSGSIEITSQPGEGAEARVILHQTEIVGK
jgi:signal transduction histidine kinase